MHIVLKRGSIDKPLTFNNDLHTIYNSFFILVCSPNTYHYACKVFSIQIFQHTICQIPPRVCTLLLFIFFSSSSDLCLLFISQTQHTQWVFSPFSSLLNLSKALSLAIFIKVVCKKLIHLFCLWLKYIILSTREIGQSWTCKHPEW